MLFLFFSRYAAYLCLVLVCGAWYLGGPVAALITCAVFLCAEHLVITPRRQRRA